MFYLPFCQASPPVKARWSMDWRRRVARWRLPGFGPPTVLVLLGELGPEFADKFATAKHFGSWLGLCPDNRITGGKLLSAKTRDVKSRVATALRMAAQSLSRAQNYFGDLYRRWKARLGGPKAVTAMAHKALMETCDENARRFKDATEFFEKNLREEEGQK
jgi:transposase